jgi:hypothetical protein
MVAVAHSSATVTAKVCDDCPAEAVEYLTLAISVTLAEKAEYSA